MTQPTDTTAADRAERNARNGLPLNLVALLQVPGKQDIFALFDNGLVRHCLPSEWASRGDTPVITGTSADYLHADALARALKV